MRRATRLPPTRTPRSEPQLEPDPGRAVGLAGGTVDVAELAGLVGVGQGALRGAAAALRAVARAGDLQNPAGHRCQRRLKTDPLAMVHSSDQGNGGGLIDLAWSVPVRDFSGSIVELATTTWSCSGVWIDRSVFLGEYWRSRPLMFSLLPRCQGA